MRAQVLFEIKERHDPAPLALEENPVIQKICRVMLFAIPGCIVTAYSRLNVNSGFHQ
jgi:hypothetical protein